MTFLQCYVVTKSAYIVDLETLEAKFICFFKRCYDVQPMNSYLRVRMELSF